MLIGIGKDTKKLTELTGLDKTYIATIDFSKKSDTRDVDFWEYFEELKLEDLKVPEQSQIQTVLQKLIPEAELPLTPFSAKKMGGKKLYEEARKGNLIQSTRMMRTQDFEIINYEFPVLKVKISVGSGTYIRSIAHRLGEQLGLGGILVGLRRTKVGEFEMSIEEQSKSRDELRVKEI